MLCTFAHGAGSRRLHWGQSRREKGREIPCAPTARGRRLRLAQASESARPPATRKRGSAPRQATAGQRPAPSNSGAAPRARQQSGWARGAPGPAWRVSGAPRRAISSGTPRRRRGWGPRPSMRRLADALSARCIRSRSSKPSRSPTPPGFPSSRQCTLGRSRWGVHHWAAAPLPGPIARACRSVAPSAAMPRADASSPRSVVTIITGGAGAARSKRPVRRRGRHSPDSRGCWQRLLVEDEDGPGGEAQHLGRGHQPAAVPTVVLVEQLEPGELHRLAGDEALVRGDL